MAYPKEAVQGFSGPGLGCGGSPLRQVCGGSPLARTVLAVDDTIQERLDTRTFIHAQVPAVSTHSYQERSMLTCFLRVASKLLMVRCVLLHVRTADEDAHDHIILNTPVRDHVTYVTLKEVFASGLLLQLDASPLDPGCGQVELGQKFTRSFLEP